MSGKMDLTVRHAISMLDGLGVEEVVKRLGVVGPLWVNGVSANGDNRVPLARTEVVLVAKYYLRCRPLDHGGGRE